MSHRKQISLLHLPPQRTAVLEPRWPRPVPRPDRKHHHPALGGAESRCRPAPAPIPCPAHRAPWPSLTTGPALGFPHPRRRSHCALPPRRPTCSRGCGLRTAARTGAMAGPGGREGAEPRRRREGEAWILQLGPTSQRGMVVIFTKI
ncbi:hypothetical protein GQ55_7G110100 [Panicum hallii var. hallii]|uniref:Uncharacterized protein n=1 Tax=Panicum hallii var. hallii TaxID=1504633 RepID=A0A2T7CTY0_9POAL|nr:hypothetical protein GQ55_7G110100 [Panicum hallii var. hallii]